ncbi:MAG: hypothetical protein KAF91_10010 [Nostoc sp. TH1S01]|nr:hypothetical protein [Nostoc sp. TH1S01]
MSLSLFCCRVVLDASDRFCYLEAQGNYIFNFVSQASIYVQQQLLLLFLAQGGSPGVSHVSDWKPPDEPQKSTLRFFCF